GDARRFALRRLALRAKREGAHETAVELWREAGAEGDADAWRELAIHHEHRARDLRQALAAVDRALDCLSGPAEGARRQAAPGLLRRRERLLRKLDGRGR